MRQVDSLGHRPIGISNDPDKYPEAQVAILNLLPEDEKFEERVELLQDQGTHIVCHVGHVEKELMRRAREAGCDQVVTHSSIVKDLPKILSKAEESIE